MHNIGVTEIIDFLVLANLTSGIKMCVLGNLVPQRAKPSYSRGNVHGGNGGRKRVNKERRLYVAGRQPMSNLFYFPPDVVGVQSLSMEHQSNTSFRRTYRSWRRFRHLYSQCLPRLH